MLSEALKDITYFGMTDHRNAGIPFGVRRIDRFSHFYVIGKTGTGKSHLLRLMMEQDLARGTGFAVFDPHGDLATEIAIASEIDRPSDLLFVDLHDEFSPWRLNPFHGVPQKLHSVAAAGLIDVFKKQWPDDWGPRFEHVLRNVIFTLLETPSATLLDAQQLLVDKDYRDAVAKNLDNRAVRDFWQEEFNRYSPAFRSVVIAPLQNKLGAL